MPTLRFPGFTDEWKKMGLSELLDFYSTNSLSWDQLDYNGNGIKNLHYGLIHVGLPTLVDAKKERLPYIKGDFTPRNYEVVEIGDVAFADASEDTNEVAKAVEFVNLSEGPIVFGLHTIHGRDKKELTVPGFKGYYFSSSAFHNQVKHLAQGTKIFSVSPKILSECSVCIPSKSEQKKITGLLTLIDERIATQNKIIERLQSLIGGIREQLYSSEEYYKIGELVTQVSKRNKQRENLPILSVSNKYGFISQSEQFEDRVVASEDTANYKIVSLDDFAYNPARINIGSIARLKTYKQGIVSPMYVSFHTNGLLLPVYLDYFFKTKSFADEVEKRLEGSVRKCLTFDALCEIDIPMFDLSRQKDISDKIGKLENKVQLEGDILNQDIRQREYFLNALFI